MSGCAAVLRAAVRFYSHGLDPTPGKAHTHSHTHSHTFADTNSPRALTPNFTHTVAHTVTHFFSKSQVPVERLMLARREAWRGPHAAQFSAIQVVHPPSYRE